MALPDKNIVQKLQFSLDGHPWCNVTTKSSINVDSLQFSLDGNPWWGHGGESTPTPTGFKIYLGSVQIQKMYLGSVEITKAYLGTVQL